jgi:hypothetical protein
MKTENLKANQQQDKQNPPPFAAPAGSDDMGTTQTPISQAARAVSRLKNFINAEERQTIFNACVGEEGEFYRTKLVELAELVGSMPTTYETDGQGDQSTVYLHYFTPASDFYITERDMEEEQRQAFGLACIWEQELGYINIAELIEAGAELDLYWSPKTLGQVKAERLLSDVNYTGHPMHY